MRSKSCKITSSAHRAPHAPNIRKYIIVAPKAPQMLNRMPAQSSLPAVLLMKLPLSETTGAQLGALQAKLILREHTSSKWGRGRNCRNPSMTTAPPHIRLRQLYNSKPAVNRHHFPPGGLLELPAPKMCNHTKTTQFRSNKHGNNATKLQIVVIQSKQHV